MCNICSILIWSVDIVQRILTCLFAVILCCVIGFALLVATLVGIAYGYNYSIAEFKQMNKKEGTIFMRRGDFHNSPNFLKKWGNDGENFKVLDEGKVSKDLDRQTTSWRQSHDNHSYLQIITNAAQLSTPTSAVYPHFRRLLKLPTDKAITKASDSDEKTITRKLIPIYKFTNEANIYNNDQSNISFVQMVNQTELNRRNRTRLEDADYSYEENFTYKPVK